MSSDIFEFKVKCDVEWFISRVQKDPQLLCQMFEKACIRTKDIWCEQYRAHRKEKKQCDFYIAEYGYVIVEGEGEGEDPEPTVFLALRIKGFSFDCNNNVALDIAITNAAYELDLLPEYFLCQIEWIK